MPFGPVLPANMATAHLTVTSFAIYAAAFIVIAIATVRRPVLGVSALILLDPFAFYRWIGFTTLTLPKVALLAVIFGLLLRKRAFRVLLRKPISPLLIAIVLVAGAIALSVWHATASAPALRETLKWFEYAAIFGTCASAFYADPDDALIRWPVLFATGLVVALALPELFFGATSGIIIARTEIPRIAGPLEGPNQLAGYLGLALPILLAYTLTQGRRWPEIFVVAGGVVATIFTFSRAGIVALLLALCLVAMLCVRAKAAHMIFAGLAVAVLAGSIAAWRILAAGVGLASLQKHGIEIYGGLGTHRELWTAAIRLWRTHPFWGIGAGNFELQVGPLLHARIKTHANSLYLQSLVEGGLPLLGASLYLVYSSIATFVGRAATPLSIAALAASVALALHQVLDYLIFYPKVGTEWMILLGIAGADLTRRSRQTASSS